MCFIGLSPSETGLDPSPLPSWKGRTVKQHVFISKNLLFQGRSIEEFPLCVKEKVTTAYVVSGWIAVPRAIF